MQSKLPVELMGTSYQRHPLIRFVLGCCLIDIKSSELFRFTPGIDNIDVFSCFVISLCYCLSEIKIKLFN